jgi:hypothetical protein
VGQDKYEIHITVLTRTDLGQLVQHCLLVMHKINQEVGSDARVRYLSYLAVFPRTLSIALTSVWDNVMDAHPSH